LRQSDPCFEKESNINTEHLEYFMNYMKYFFHQDISVSIEFY